MTVENMVKEAAKGLDNLIPPKELGKHDYHQINVTVPNPILRVEYPNYEWTYADVVACFAMALGFFCLGIASKGL